jgi:hypothetical protein
MVGLRSAFEECMLSSIPIRVGSSEPASDDQRLPLTGDGEIGPTPLDLLRRFNPELVGFGIADRRRDRESDNEPIDDRRNKEDEPE